MAFKQFGWVSDGVYDYEDYQVRYHVVDGNPKTAISRMWIEKGAHETLPKELRQPWGTFPNFPPKPPKPTS
jgi:hypothetical protein